MLESKLADLLEETSFDAIEEMILSISDPDLAKGILFKMQFDSPGWCSNTSISSMLGVEQYKVDAILPVLEDYGLVDLKSFSETLRSMHPESKWDIRRVEEVEKYLRSDVPYGPHVLLERGELSDETLLRAMNSVANLVQFSYSKTVALDINILREIRDKSHESLKFLKQKEKDEIYNQCNINCNWKNGLPNFVGTSDSTWSDHGDVNHFTLYGNFPNPEDAFREDFGSANADAPNDKGKFPRIGLLSVYRNRDKGNQLTFYNSRYSVAAYRTLAYQKEVTQILPLIQNRLEEVLEE